MKRRQLILCCTMTIAVACGAQAAAAASPELVIGAPNALTGPYSFIGVPVKNAVTVLIDQVNAKGGVNGVPIKLINEDDASEKAQAITLVTRMAKSDNALVIVGPTSSIEANAVAPVANELRIPMITSASSPTVRQAGKWSFNVAPAPANMVAALGTYAVDKLKIRKVALIAVRDNDAFIGQKNVLRDTVLKSGGKVVMDELVDGADTDFSGLATKLAAADIDSIAIFTPAELGANVVVQARQAGVPDKVQVIGAASMVSQAFLDTGGKAVGGAVLAADYFAGTKSPLNQAFVETYTKKYGIAPDNWAGIGYAMAQVAVEALTKAGPNPTREKVRDAMEKISGMPTILGAGTYSFVQNREPKYEPSILRVKDGKFQTIDP